MPVSHFLIFSLFFFKISADLLILMSDVDGIYNKPPWEDGARLMHTYTSQDRNTIEFGKKSKVSRCKQFASVTGLFTAQFCFSQWNKSTMCSLCLQFTDEKFLRTFFFSFPFLFLLFLTIKIII